MVHAPAYNEDRDCRKQQAADRHNHLAGSLLLACNWRAVTRLTMRGPLGGSRRRRVVKRPQDSPEPLG
eukprot:2447727-Pyramimonas_sp.AAC.1